MRRTEVLQKIWTMRFVELYASRQEPRLTQEEAARMLGSLSTPFGVTSTIMRTKASVDWLTSACCRFRTGVRRWTRCYPWRHCIGNVTTAGM